MRNSPNLGIIYPSDNDLALRKIYFKIQERFEAEKQEFQMSNTGLVKLNHNDGIVRILKMSDAIGDKVRADRGDVAGKSCPRQNMGEGVRDKIEEKGEAESPCLRPLPLAKKLLICPLTETAVCPPMTSCISR